VNASFDQTKIALERKMGRSLTQCESGDNMRMCSLELSQKKTVTLMAEDNPKSTTTLIGCCYVMRNEAAEADDPASRQSANPRAP
jgi:hypothetical protein